MDVRTLGNVLHALGVHGVCATRSERGLRRGLWPACSAGDGWAVWAVLWECSGAVAAASLLSKLGHQRRAPSRRQRERGIEVRCRVGVACRWGHGASPGRKLITDWGSRSGKVR
jgi:hypothetical protein